MHSYARSFLRHSGRAISLLGPLLMATKLPLKRWSFPSSSPPQEQLTTFSAITDVEFSADRETLAIDHTINHANPIHNSGILKPVGKAWTAFAVGQSPEALASSTNDRLLSEHLQYPGCVSNKVEAEHRDHLNKHVCSDEMLAAHYLASAGPGVNLEVVKYIRRPSPLPGSRHAAFRQRSLYGAKAIATRGTILRRVSEELHYKSIQRRRKLQRSTAKQQSRRGGLLVALERRLAKRRKPVRRLPTTVQLQINSNTPPYRKQNLAVDYAEAFKQWDSSMSKTISGYACKPSKRTWYTSLWDWPLPIMRE